MDSDETLITAYKNGEKQALTTLVERHLDAVYAYVARTIRERDDADDITQETFFKMWKYLNRFTLGKPFRPWLFTIARNTMLDQLRKKDALTFSQLQSDNAEDFGNSIPDTAMTQETESIKKEDSDVLNYALSQLPAQYREVLQLRYQSNMTFDEIGKLLHKPLHTVKNQERRAREQLKTLLSKGPADDAPNPTPDTY